MSSLAEALRLMAGAMKRAEIRYLIGGSIAASIRGEPRMTLGTDLLADIRAEQVDRLVALLGADWYADADAIREALARGRPFNLIHIKTAQKFGLFPVVSDFHRSELERCTEMPVGTGPESFPVASLEDILLAKLVWYREGGEVSERQWRDIGGLLEAGAGYDPGYLEHWAKRLGVLDLLERVRG